tara:strand:+ start:669 stop:1523 length:855 start_codon:yes stop_codon:yes gene_type:complete
MLSSYKNIKRDENNKRPCVKPQLVLISIVIDRSASMQTMKGKHIEMCEKMIENIKSQSLIDDIPTKLTFRSFDDIVETICDKVNPHDFDIDSNILKNKLEPRGCTRFRDTIMEEIDHLYDQKKSYLKSLPSSIRQLSPKVVMILNVVTDGEDNMSINSEFECRKVVTNFREDGGKCILMSANLNSQLLAERIGFSKKTSITVHNSDNNAINSAFISVTNLQRELSQGFDNIQFSQADRGSSMPMLSTSLLNQSFDDNDDELDETVEINNQASQLFQNLPKLKRY